ncbi:MAG: hypothetical protein LBM16_00540, partial [Clostridiales bacterium]|nr:hypothetical protein [Clostridiales bacterium]
CNVDIFADSAKFSARRAESKITVTQESGKSFLYSVTAHKIDSYSAELNKTSFNFNDSGYIYIKNFSGEEIVVEVYADSPYLKFEGVRYRVRERAQIPFSVKVGRLSLALSGDPFNKQTAIHGNITISTEGRHTALGEIIPEKILSFVIAKPIQER